MTTATPVKSAPSIASRPAVAAGGAGSTGPNIDVVKTLKKYLWVLVGAAIVGAVIGVVAHFVLLRVYPLYRAQVLFQVLPPQSELTIAAVTNLDEDEQERFAQSQVALMKSDGVIQRVVTDPRLQSQGGRWAQMWMEGGRFRAEDASEWLYDHLSARVIPSTDYLEMSLSWTNAVDVTNVVSLIRETYLNMVKEQSAAQNVPQRTQLEKQIRDLETLYRDKQNERDQILKNDEIDSIEQRYAADNQQLLAVIATLHEIRGSIESARTQLDRYEQDLNAMGGPTYSDEMRSAVEAHPLIATIHQTIASLEAQRAAMLVEFGPEHRQMITMQNMIDSWKTKLDQEREAQLGKMFGATIDSLRNMISVLTAQEAELASEQERLVKRLIDLTKTMVKIGDLDLEISGVLESKKDLDLALKNMQGVALLQTATRVIVLQQERIPDKPVFPDIFIMLPAGAVLFLGLTAGAVFLRELLDQRVKGPGDVALIPRTRVLGFVPDASEDSATPADQVSRAFRTAPKGVVAESFRQLRAPVLKRMELAGHKTVMVIAGMPTSGASAVVSNLAEACAASDRRVLVIDANFRRPAQHKIFGAPDSPGLSDVLAGDTTLQAAAQPTNSPNLSVLTAGSARYRVVERLATDTFAEMLALAASEYDLVLIDVPPAIVAGDGVAIANKCDASLLVVKAYAEKRGLVSRVRNELGDTKAEFLGVVVNGVRASAGGYLRGNIRATQSYASESV
ncbi:MAG TPA: polysaccharide biosynthesis tyrosine autokinase [Phycisphaerales bacterium]|nr:polysaccharide biosynthesis tyrosine autokinase [Phycisphaerales bacterium]